MMKTSSKMKILICHILIFSIIVADCTEIQTTLGIVKGKLVTDVVLNVTFYSFTGIPYAEPPVGDLRFKPPLRKSPWQDVLLATQPGFVCPQTTEFHSKEEMSEDCLTFNVYTPADGLGKSLPVIINIHDGDFNSQSGKDEPIYGPQLLIQQNIVVVTLNYRLGALGFLSCNTESISGNAGLKDVILATKIIRENISKFGGDPGRITINGNGAGAAMIQYMMVADKKCREKFNNAMLHSGSFLSPKYFQTNPKQNAKLLATELNIEWTDDAAVVEKLKLADAFDIVKAQEAINTKDTRRGFRVFKPFKPTVEIQNSGAVLTRTPLELMKEGSVCDLPLFIGIALDEGLEMWPMIKSEPKLIKQMNDNFDLIVPEDIEYPQEVQKNLTAKIKDFYFRDRNISMNNIEHYFDLITDTQYSYSVDLFIKLFKTKKTSSVYRYLWAGDTALNWYKALYKIQKSGSAHNDNLGYTFITSATKSVYANMDFTVQRALERYLNSLRSFIVNGEPPMYSSPWPEASSKGYHMVQNNDGAFPIYNRPIPARIRFWESVYEQYQSYKKNSTGQTQSQNQTNGSSQTNQAPKTNAIVKLVNDTVNIVKDTVGGVVHLLIGK